MINEFKAAHKKSWYDTEDRYLDAVYRKNKKKIDAAYLKEAKEKKKRKRKKERRTLL